MGYTPRGGTAEQKSMLAQFQWAISVVSYIPCIVWGSCCFTATVAFGIFHTLSVLTFDRYIIAYYSLAVIYISLIINDAQQAFTYLLSSFLFLKFLFHFILADPFFLLIHKIFNIFYTPNGFLLFLTFFLFDEHTFKILMSLNLWIFLWFSLC